MVSERATPHLHRPKLGALLHAEAGVFPNQEEENNIDESNQKSSDSTPSPRPSFYNSSNGTPSRSGEATPYFTSPWNQPSPYAQSPWIIPSPVNHHFPNDGLMWSIVRVEGHVYSLAASGDLLFTGSDSKNIRVWKNLKEFAGFKSNSGLVKAIIVHGNRIFTGHQDGKIRVWKVSSKNPSGYNRIGSLPTFKDYIKSSINPKNYVEVRRRRKVLRIKHFDAVSCLSLSEDLGLLYSGSWDTTLKVWRVSDYKCLESIDAHDDAINSVIAGFDSLVFTGSADGTVKAWRRELQGRRTKHLLVQTLLKQEAAATALAVNKETAVLYCGSSDGLVNFWEFEKHLSHGGVLRGHKMAVLCLATAGHLVFSGSADRSICVWRREPGGVHICLTVLTGHSGPVKCLVVEEDRESSHERDHRWILYSGSLDRSVKVWRVSENFDAPEWREYQTPRPSYSSPPKNKGKSQG